MSKQINLVIFLCICSLVSQAQFAIINDQDGNCNVRSAAGKGSDVIDRLSNGHLVYALPDGTNWVDIDYTKNRQAQTGSVYKDRLVWISAYKTIPAIQKNKHRIVFNKDSIRVVANLIPFQRNKHRYTYYSESTHQIKWIDQQPYFGKDGGLPTTAYGSIEVTIGHQKIQLPAAALANLYEPNFDLMEVQYDSQQRILYIHSMNSDGAGGYEVIWKIANGRYQERLVVNGF